MTPIKEPLIRQIEYEAAVSQALGDECGILLLARRLPASLVFSRGRFASMHAGMA